VSRDTSVETERRRRLLSARDADLVVSGLADPRVVKRLMLTKVLSTKETETLTGEKECVAYEIPYFQLDGTRSGFSRWKLIPVGDEKPGMKYYQLEKTIPQIYLPRLVNWQKIAADPKQPIIITEGEKKAACACLHGLPCMGLGGVWTFGSKKWRYRVLPDFDKFVWDGREVEVCYDSDLSANENVQRACEGLLAELRSRGARTFLRRLPATDGKTGLDDLLVAVGVEGYLKLDRAEWGAQLVDPPTDPMPNARRVLKSEFAHPDHALLVHHGGIFFAWSGTCWPAMEDDALRARLYRWGEDKEYARMTGRGGQERFAPTRNKIGDLAGALAAVAHIPTETPLPSWLDNRDAPPASELVACANGLLHVPSRKLSPHTPLFYTRYSLPFDFNARAPSPKRWLKFVAQLLPNDEESIATLQDIFGYLVGGDTMLQKMFLIEGPKRAGKGTIARVLTAMLGSHNVAAPTLGALSDNFGLWPLIDKPVAIISDARLGGRDTSIISERLLPISGEDSLTVPRKFLPAWTGKMPTRFLLLSNELPRFMDPSGAMASRFVVLRLRESFYGRENPALTEELCAELPGILNWALDGLDRLRKRGYFVQPRASAEAIRELEELGSPVISFVRERCELGPTLFETTDDLFRAWCAWCEGSGHQSGAKETFAKNLRSAVPSLERRQRGGRGGKRWVLVGIRKKPAAIGTKV
jgi:putative DNA primase/helicase